MKWFNMLPEQSFVLPKDVVCGQQLGAPCYLGMFILVMTKLVLRRAQRKLRTSSADTLPLMVDSSSSCADFFRPRCTEYCIMQLVTLMYYPGVESLAIFFFGQTKSLAILLRSCN